MNYPNKYKKFLLVFNSVNGRNKANKRLHAIIQRLSKRNCSFEIVDSNNIASRKDLNSFDCIVAVGGDGTILSIIDVISKFGAKLAIIPCGTANLFAASLLVPENIDKAIDVLFNGKASLVDLGKANNKYFALRVGVGFDADIISGACTWLKDKFGYLAYLIQGFKNCINLNTKMIKLVIDGKTHEVNASSVIVANSGNMFKNLVSIAPNSSSVDGKLDVFVLMPKNFIDFVTVFCQLLAGKYVNNASVMYEKGRNIKIETNTFTSHIDGEPIKKQTSLNIEVIPKALQVLMPVTNAVPEIASTLPSNFSTPAYEKVFVEV